MFQTWVLFYTMLRSRWKQICWTIIEKNGYCIWFAFYSSWVPIKEVKNLRGRVNFHNATKIIAKITYRENFVREIVCFHLSENVLLETSGIGVHKHFKDTMEDAETSKYIMKMTKAVILHTCLSIHSTFIVQVPSVSHERLSVY